MFRFKQFSIAQKKSAMKVGTDGVLLGAWANINGASSILDIGTGTGLIAMMCAQKNQNAKITGVEIDERAANEARENVLKSPWKNRIEIIANPIQHYQPQYSFDFIICNPPFFEQSEQEYATSRDIARANTTFSLQDFTSCCKRLLAKKGKVAVVFPFLQFENLTQKFMEYGFFKQRMRRVKGTNSAPTKRILVEFSEENVHCTIEPDLVIEPEKRHEYSEEYKYLTKDFYLNF